MRKVDTYNMQKVKPALQILLFCSVVALYMVNDGEGVNIWLNNKTWSATPYQCSRCFCLRLVSKRFLWKRYILGFLVFIKIVRLL